MSTIISPWQLNQLDTQLIDLAFAEDLGLPYRDVTTAALFPENKGISSAKIISKQAGLITMCGVPVVRAVLAKLSEQCEVQSHYHDGDLVPAGATLMTMIGPAHILLMSERILLNFLQRLCAIATHTAKFVDKVSHTQTKILDTRKTLPGFRHLEKYAVRCGGGVNHRMGLYDAVMIKDTHIDLLGGMSAALNKLPEAFSKTLPVIVEVRTKHELTMVLDQGRDKVTRVLLDNMSLERMRECVAMCRGVLPTEASGNVDLENVALVAETGVDFISIGKLTHSAGNVDLSMKCDINYV